MRRLQNFRSVTVYIFSTLINCANFFTPDPNCRKLWAFTKAARASQVCKLGRAPMSVRPSVRGTCSCVRPFVHHRHHYFNHRYHSRSHINLQIAFITCKHVDTTWIVLAVCVLHLLFHICRHTQSYLLVRTCMCTESETQKRTQGFLQRPRIYSGQTLLKSDKACLNTRGSPSTSNIRHC